MTLDLFALVDKHLPNGSTADKLALLADVMKLQADAWDEGVTKASPYGGAYLRSLLIESPYCTPIEPALVQPS